jgi:hypothetical protein
MKPKPSSPHAKGKSPRVFISYTHENVSHKAWVLKLATDLRKYGVDAILDRWECKYGSELTLFMEKGIRDSERVLLVCTPSYQKKANSGTGGVGYERSVVTAEIAKNIQTEKFICVLRSGDDKSSIPSFAMSRLFIDFRKDNEYEDHLLELLRDIHIAPLNPKPPLGRSPFRKVSVKRKASLVTSSKPASTKSAKEKPPLGDNPFTPEVIAALNSPIRRRLSDTRTAVTHKFDIAGHEGFITVGLFDDGRPGELQIKMAKEGSTIGGLTDSIAILTSLSLQYGVPLEALLRKFAHMRFEPSGFTKNPEIRNASSIIDYIFRWMALQFVPGYRESVNRARSQPELAMPGLLEEMKKKVNRPVPELSKRRLATSF